MVANSPRLIRYFFLPFVLLLAIIYLAHGQLRLADPDEFQALTNAFDTASGLTPYRDFWDNHGPLSTWIWVPAVSLWRGGHSLIFWLRGVMWINTLAISGVAFWLMGRLFPARQFARWGALVFLLAAPPFLAKGLEIRGDNPANLLATAGLAALAYGLAGRRWCFFVAGLCVGTIAGFTLKAVIIGAALGLFALCWYVRNRQWPRFADIGLAVLGAAIPVAVIIVGIRLQHLDEAFRLCYFGANSSRGFAGYTSSELTQITKKAPLWGFLALAVLGKGVWRAVRWRADGAEMGLIVISVFYLLQFLLFLPTKNLQSLLPGFLPLAMLAGLYAEPVILWRRWTARTGTLATVLVAAGFVAGLWAYDNLPNRELPKQVAFADKAMAAALAEHTIFDPSGVVFLKAKPGALHVLVTFVRDMHRAGAIDLQIPEMLRTNDIKTIVFDKRIEDLRPTDLAYIKDNFLPVANGPDCLLLRRRDLGVASDLAGLAGKELDWWLHGKKHHPEQVSGIGNGDWFRRYMNLYRLNHNTDSAKR